jgi:hypothetical protein
MIQIGQTYLRRNCLGKSTDLREGKPTEEQINLCNEGLPLILGGRIKKVQ